MLNVRYLLFLLGCYFGFSACATAGPDELKLMHIGNSFSWNSTHYLPQLARAGGRKITIFAASKGGCSLQCHADFLQLARQNEPDGRAYKVTRVLKNYTGAVPNVSLDDALKAEKWDVITIQQTSRQSVDLATFEPYGETLISQIKRDAPGAKILLHKTWAYHDEHLMFKQQQEGPVSHTDMHSQLTQAYNRFAARYGLAIIPSADAMSLAYQQLPKADDEEKASTNNTKQAASIENAPSIKQRSNMLYSDDGAHLDIAGKYLTASVWYEVLFNESVVNVDFVPEGLDAKFAAELRALAHRAVKQHNEQTN
ncbi:DUF4886 domain-containing protein [Rheinheimera sp. NSM]|uniref:DUF4886 domain-containing protein n=1 Tax=Rheinheimera sp. NSM TaxID=3457884 RepID=UPI0040354729